MTNINTVSTRDANAHTSQKKIVEEQDGKIQLNLHHPRIDRNERFAAN